MKKFIETKLMKNEDFRRAVGIDVENFLDESIPIPSAKSLTHNRIYPYKFFKELKDEQQTVVVFSISLSRTGEKIETKSGTIEFVVMTHKNLIKTDYQMTRIDYISVLIDEMFNRIKNDNVIKRIQFIRDEEISINNSFIGYTVKYSFESFNTTVVKSYVESQE